MILTKTPLRISFVGGGSDRPSFYLEAPGACVAASIDKYVYVAVNDKYDGTIRAAYSVTENVAKLDDLQHELIREVLRLTGCTQGIEVHSIADIPAGTGLGSSSSFTVGLLAALRPGKVPATYAEKACEVEIDLCNHPIGKQDQYAAAFGGVNLYGFRPKGVTVKRLACNYAALSGHCLLLDTGIRRDRDAGDVLDRQQQDHEQVRELAALAYRFAGQLTDGDLRGCGATMDLAWQIKRQFVHSPHLDTWYEQARTVGAWGGKLCGAGGGGFLLFLAPLERHAPIAWALGLRHVPIQVGVAGSEVVWQAR